ncbi:MAG: Cof-type HAD-IIB family hydrolase [Firmicutes bacterium]|nr:Cof-type HAD-IIB family hydrolase [Bacillota bacterium]
MIRLVALDLDGTSLRHGGVISPGLEEAVARAQSEGIRVILATGRMAQSADVFRRALGILPGPMISYNGAEVVSMPENAVWVRHPVDEKAARALVTLALSQNILVQVYVADELWVSRDAERVRDYVKNNHVPVSVRDQEALLDWPEPPVKILLQAEPEVVDRFRPVAERHMAGHPVRLFKSQLDYLEMVGEQVGKGRALAEVADRLQLSANQVMAIGDNENDMDMLAWAGLGIAMGQSHDDIKAVSDFVTASVDEGGAAEAMGHFLWGVSSPRIEAGGKVLR